MTLNYKRLIVERLENQLHGLNSVHVHQDIWDSFASLVLQDIVTIQPWEGHLCLAFHVTVINMQKFAILNLENVFVSITRPGILVTNVQEVTMVTL